MKPTCCEKCGKKTTNLYPPGGVWSCRKWLCVDCYENTVRRETQRIVLSQHQQNKECIDEGKFSPMFWQ
jgi:hypothetical protein